MSAAVSSSASARPSEDYQLELFEPLLDEGYAVWPLPRSLTNVGFTEDCDIVLPLLHLSGDLKFNERDNFAISFVEETQEWSVDKVTDGGGFKESMRPACNTGALVSRQHWYNREGYFHRSLALHLTVPGSGGRFIYALPYDGLSRYETDVEELARKRGAVLKNV